MADGLGPYADVNVITVGTTIPEINQLLAQGWRLLDISIHEEILHMGGGGRPRTTRRVAVAAMGRAISASTNAAEAAEMREQASEQGEDAMGSTVVLSPLEVDLDGADNDIQPLEIPQSSEPIAARGPGRPRRIAKGSGEFEASGIRG